MATVLSAEGVDPTLPLGSPGRRVLLQHSFDSRTIITHDVLMLRINSMLDTFYATRPKVTRIHFRLGDYPRKAKA